MLLVSGHSDVSMSSGTQKKSKNSLNESEKSTGKSIPDTIENTPKRKKNK